MKKIAKTLLRTALLVVSQAAYATSVEEKSANSIWPQTLAVLLLTFGLAAVTGYLIDFYRMSRQAAAKPGADAFLDQMLAGNGSRLNLPER